MHTFSRLFSVIALLTGVAPTLELVPIPMPSVKSVFPTQGHHVVPLLLYTSVLVPWPAAIQRLSFHAILLPLVENVVVPCPVHVCPKSVDVAIVFVPSPTAIAVCPFQKTELALVVNGCVADAVHVLKWSDAYRILSAVVDFPAIIHCVPNHCTSLTAVSKGLLSPVHDRPSAE